MKRTVSSRFLVPMEGVACVRTLFTINSDAKFSGLLLSRFGPREHGFR